MEIFDILSHEYGWTTEYILSRTFREIEYRLYYINRRRRIEQANKVALAGGKPKIAIPKRRVTPKVEKKTEEEIKQDELIQKAFKKRFGNGKKNSI